MSLVALAYDGYESDVFTQTGISSPTDNVLLESSKLIEKRFHDKYKILRDAYENRIRQLSEVLEKTCSQLFSDEILIELKSDRTSSAFIPAHMSEVISRQLQSESENYIHKVVEKLSVLEIEQTKLKEYNLLLNSRLQSAEKELQQSKQAEAHFIPTSQKLQHVEESFKAYTEQSKKDILSLETTIQHMQLRETQLTMRLESVSRDLSDKLNECSELKVTIANKSRDLGNLEQSFEQSSRELVMIEGMERQEQALKKEMMETARLVTAERNALYDETQQLRSQLQFANAEMERCKSITQQKTEAELVSKQKLTTLMAQVESMLAQEAQDSNDAIQSVHEKMKEFRQRLSSELHREKRLNAALQEELTSCKVSKEESVREQRRLAEEESRLRSLLTMEQQHNTKLQLQLQEDSNQLTELRVKYVEASQQAKQNEQTFREYERLKQLENSLIEEKAVMKAERSKEADLNHIEQRTAAYRMHYQNQLGDIKNQLRHSYSFGSIIPSSSNIGTIAAGMGSFMDYNTSSSSSSSNNIRNTVISDDYDSNYDTTAAAAVLNSSNDGLTMEVSYKNTIQHLVQEIRRLRETQKTNMAALESKVRSDCDREHQLVRHTLQEKLEEASANIDKLKNMVHVAKNQSSQQHRIIDKLTTELQQKQSEIQRQQQLLSKGAPSIVQQESHRSRYSSSSFDDDDNNSTYHSLVNNENINLLNNRRSSTGSSSSSPIRNRMNGANSLTTTNQRHHSNSISSSNSNQVMKAMTSFSPPVVPPVASAATAALRRASTGSGFDSSSNSRNSSSSPMRPPTTKMAVTNSRMNQNIRSSSISNNAGSSLNNITLTDSSSSNSSSLSDRNDNNTTIVLGGDDNEQTVKLHSETIVQLTTELDERKQHEVVLLAEVDMLKQQLQQHVTAALKESTNSRQTVVNNNDMQRELISLRQEIEQLRTENKELLSFQETNMLAATGNGSSNNSNNKNSDDTSTAAQSSSYSLAAVQQLEEAMHHQSELAAIATHELSLERERIVAIRQREAKLFQLLAAVQSTYAIQMQQLRIDLAQIRTLVGSMSPYTEIEVRRTVNGLASKLDYIFNHWQHKHEQALHADRVALSKAHCKEMDLLEARFVDQIRRQSEAHSEELDTMHAEVMQRAERAIGRFREDDNIDSEDEEINNNDAMSDDENEDASGSKSMTKKKKETISAGSRSSSNVGRSVTFAIDNMTTTSVDQFPIALSSNRSSNSSNSGSSKNNYRRRHSAATTMISSPPIPAYESVVVGIMDALIDEQVVTTTSSKQILALAKAHEEPSYAAQAAAKSLLSGHLERFLNQLQEQYLLQQSREKLLLHHNSGSDNNNIDLNINKVS